MRWSVLILSAVLGSLSWAAPYAAEAQPCDAPRLDLNMPAGASGDVVELTATLVSGSTSVVGLRADLSDATLGVEFLAAADGTPDCAVGPMVDKSFAFQWLPPRCRIDGTCDGVQGAIFNAFNLTPLPDGEMFRCRVRIVTTTPGEVPIACDNAGAGTSDGQPIPLCCPGSAVIVEPPATASPTPSATGEPSDTPTDTPVPTVTPTPVATATMSATPPTATPSATAAATDTASPTGAATGTSTATATTTQTPAASLTPTDTVTVTATASVTATATETATPQSSSTATATGAATATPTASAPASATASPSATLSASATATPSASITATATATATASSTATASHTPTASPTVAGGTPSPTASASATPTTVPCLGDCAGDGTVTVADLVLGVNIALGNFPVSACPAFDPTGSGVVTIADLIVAVNNAQLGCPS